MKSAFRNHPEGITGASLWVALSGWRKLFTYSHHLSTLSTRAAKLGVFSLLPLSACLASSKVYSHPIVPANDGTGTINIHKGDSFEIVGGTLSGDSRNLFHSFTQFNLNAGQTANFLAIPEVRNILGRINGGNPSIINGLIQVTGSQANLYLMNPSGFIFGSNSQLNISGSFTATTANQIGFGNNQWFSSTGTNNYAALVGTPNSFDFTHLQPSAIINEGDWTVSEGKDLNLIGGTVINTGDLSAPKGSINLVSVPGANLVRISQENHLLSLEVHLKDLPTDASAIAPSTLPQMLTSGQLSAHANKFTVTQTGEVQLTGSGIQIKNGDLVLTQSSLNAGTINLLSSNNLKLIGSQLQATANINLFANNIVQIRDTLTNPFIARSGENLTIQGNQTVDILALNHPQISFVSSGNLHLISDGVISGDAHFQAGGNFEIRNLSGSSGEFISLFDPIIRSSGDVIFGDYTGVALKIEAQGSIIGGDITIIAPDAAVPISDPDSSLLQTEKAVILRAGVDTISNANIPPEISVGNTTFIPITPPTSPGSIIVNNINTSGTTDGLANGGSVIFSAPGDIFVGSINSSSTFGDGGSISLESRTGRIQTAGLINSSSEQGLGGSVTLNAFGDIDVLAIDAQSGNLGTGSNFVNITTPSLFRASGTFLAQNGIDVSISTTGGLGGAIRIEHGGGERLIPFTVGNAEINGTAGAIASSADNVISPFASFLESYFQDNIQILTTNLPPTPTPPTPTPPTPTPPTPTPPTPTPPTPTPPTPTPPTPTPPTPTPPTPTPPTPTPPTPTPPTPTPPTPTPPTPTPPTPTPPTPTPPTPIPLVQQQQISRQLQTWALNTNQQPLAIVDLDSPILLELLRNEIRNTLAQGDIERAILLIETLYTQELNQYSNETFSVEVESLEQLQNTLDTVASQIGIQPAIVYIFSTEEQLNLLLLSPKGPPAYFSVPEAKRAALLSQIQELNLEVTNPRKRRTTSYLNSAQQLYQWIIKPLEAELQARGIDTLVFSMDAGLRSMPIAALHDGEQFLIEKYSYSLVPSLNLVDTRYSSFQDSRVLAMGASEFTEQTPLPAVPLEVHTIAGELWRGEAFLNEQFTRSNLEQQRQEQPFGIIHLATHGEFQSGDPSNSYIQLWDTKLRLDQLRELGWNNPPLDLLVLSACRMALGDADAELGFAGFAVQAGVKTAVASLWYVSDEGTLGLMTEFYQQLKTSPTKAEALRRAQLSLLRQKVRLESGQVVGLTSGENLSLPTDEREFSDRNLAHPYYWAAFTMIGSPW